MRSFRSSFRMTFSGTATYQLVEQQLSFFPSFALLQMN
jgi:hypothetical protein